MSLFLFSLHYGFESAGIIADPGPQDDYIAAAPDRLLKYSGVESVEDVAEL